MQPEYDDSFHRPAVRRLVALTNDELAAVLKMRCDRLHDFLKGHHFWESERIVYWGRAIPIMAAVHEALLEVQSRYPAKEVMPYMPLLPVPPKYGLERLD